MFSQELHVQLAPHGLRIGLLRRRRAGGRCELAVQAKVRPLVRISLRGVRAGLPVALRKRL
jgi:hypothetical protein